MRAGLAYVNHVKSGGATIVHVFDRKARPRVGVVDGSAVEQPRTLESLEPVIVHEQLHLLPGALDLYRLEMAPGEGRENRLKKFLATVSQKYDHVIIDTPPTPSVWMTSALIASDYFVVPVRPDPISLTGIDLLNNIVAEKTENFSLNLKCAGLILTVVESNTRVYETAIASLKKSKLWKSRLFEKSLIKRTKVAQQQLQQEFILDSGDPELTLCITQITQELLTRIGV